MSAPTALESGALARGIAWRVAPAGAPAATRPDGLPERRSEDPVARLGRRFDALCLEACDPFEIAAGLEAAGLSDAQARREYGTASVFELAEQLWARVPWRAAAPQAVAPRWELPWWRAQLRGATYVLPALVAALALGRLPGSGAHALLLASTAVSIAVGQGLSVLGHVLAGRLQSRALGRLSLAATAAAAATLLALVLAGLPLGAGVVVPLAAGAQVLFVVVATVLVVAGSDLWLAAALVPALVTAAAGVAAHVAGAPGPAGLLLPAAAALVVVVPLTAATLRATRLARTGSGPGLRTVVGGPELRVVAAAVGYGTGLALAAAVSVVAVRTGRLEADGAELAVIAAPLLATFGTGEHLLHRARRHCLDVAAGARVVAHFAGTAVGELRAALARQVVAATAVAAGAGAWLAGHGHPEAWPWVLGFAVLAGFLLLTTTLMSLGDFTAAAVLTAAAGTVLALAAALVPGDALTVGLAVLAVAVAALGVAHTVTMPRFASTAVHR